MPHAADGKSNTTPLPHLVDAAHKEQAGPPAYTAQHEEEGKAHHGIVAKKEAGLQQTMHFTPASGKQHTTFQLRTADATQPPPAVWKKIQARHARHSH
jgi:hypothetical protein